jgi:hypothetical protein
MARSANSSSMVANPVTLLPAMMGSPLLALTQ